MEMNVSPSSLQVKEKEKFFISAGSILCWDDLADQVVLDIGCGQGMSSMIFVKSFPAVKKLIAIDKYPELVDRAKEMNPHPKIEYVTADITKESTLSRWFGEIDVATSLFCFSGLADPKEAYRNVLRLLRPNGEVAVLQHFCPNYFAFVRDVAKQPKWSSYTDSVGLFIPDPTYQAYTAADYEELVTEIGFQVVDCSEASISYSVNEDGIRDILFNSCTLSIAIPDHKAEEYKSDLYETFLNYYERDDRGLLRLNNVTLTILLRKAEDSTESGESEG